MKVFIKTDSYKTTLITDNNSIEVDLGGFNSVPYYKKPKRPFKIKIKENLPLELHKQNCYVTLTYDSGIMYEGYGCLDLSTNDYKIIKGSE